MLCQYVIATVFHYSEVKCPLQEQEQQKSCSCRGWDTKGVEMCGGEPEHFCDLSHGFDFALSNLTCCHLKNIFTQIL